MLQHPPWHVAELFWLFYNILKIPPRKSRDQKTSCSSAKHQEILLSNSFDALSSNTSDIEADSAEDTSNTVSSVEPILDVSVVPASKARTNNKETCPCKVSSDGSSWLIPCASCKQSWHPSCANLVRLDDLSEEESEKVINCIVAKSWTCPWCFSSIFPRPKSHVAAKAEQSFLSNTMAAKITDNVNHTIQETITNTLEKLSKPAQMIPQIDVGFQELQKQISAISDELKSFKDKATPLSSPHPNSAPRPSKISSTKVEPGPEFTVPPTKPYEDYKEDYLTSDYANEIKEFLDTSEFVKEGQRQVLFFGERYHYKGSNKSPKPLPEVLKPLLEKLNMDSKQGLNQCLINKYVGRTSNLAAHSDSEFSIDPDSNIFTITIGESAKIMFESKSQDESQNITLTVHDRSMYSMSRDSQNDFTHKIDANPELNDGAVRYGITFRHVNWTYFNSTYAAGDSNFGKIHFGIGKGKVGAATPGLRDWAPQVADINPQKCRSYRNVVLMSGTNDLKADMVDEEEEILKIYKTYKGKFEEIRRIHPRCRLYVCPILPTRNTEVNSRVMKFNYYIRNDLLQSGLQVHFVEGFRQFVDMSNGLLKESLFDKRSDTDFLHINDAGYCILVSCIKATIYSSKEKMAQKRQVGRRSYSNVARNGLSRPVT